MANEDAGIAFRIAISSDGLTATLSFACAEGQCASEEQLLAALAAQGIQNGLHMDNIAAAVAAGSADHLLVAEGQPAVAGIDAHVESLVPVRDHAPRVDDAGRADYRDFGDIFIVHPGTPLLRRHPATPGRQGLTVTGKPLPAKPGKVCPLPACLQGAGVAPGDQDLIVATVAGHPVVEAQGIHVDPVYEVQDVSMSTGNIVFEGSVRVKGEVEPGMKIKASGNIEVHGLVDMAHLEAGGDIVIHGGALGGKDSNTSSFVCGGCFSAHHVQQVHVEAGDSIFIDDAAISSDLRAANAIVIGKSKRGMVMGGHLRAMREIRARMLGAHTRVATTIDMGVDPQVPVRLRELAEQQSKQEDLLMRVSQVIDLNAKKPGSLPAPMLEKARQTAASLSGEIAELRIRQEALQHELELAKQARVVCEQSFHEGVQINFGEACYKVWDSGDGGIFQLVDGQVKLTALADAT